MKRWRKWCLGPVEAVVALVVFLPFVRGLLLTGNSFYFRDIAGYFFPIRRFLVEGLLQGTLRYWNPYVHEGIPSSLLPVSYPLDLLQVLWPDERGFSLSLALHVPLAAVSFMVLARGLGCTRLGGACGALAYALGGFCLSTLNLYVYLQAMAWAPLIVLGLVRAAEGGRRRLAIAAVLAAVGLSTTGVEVVLQAVLVGCVLAAGPKALARCLRMAGALALALGLAATTLFSMRNLIAGSERGEGFITAVVLSHSVHPMTLVQVLVGALYGDLSDLVNTYWGSNFFPGYPYFLSLYLGAIVLTLAAVGTWHGPPFRRRIALVALAAAAVCLGRHAKLDVVVDALPQLRAFRYPAKAFFTVHLAVALLAAIGLDALLGDSCRRAWRGLAAIALGIGGLLAVAPWLPAVLPGPTRWFVSGFFPPHYPWSFRMERAALVLRDAATGGAVAVAAGLVAVLVLREKLRAVAGAALVVALMTADLLRSGAGLNPTVAPSFFHLSEEMASVAARIRGEGGRVFTCDTWTSTSYFWARQLHHGRHEAWSAATSMETLTPFFNMNAFVPTAYSLDLTMLVPRSRLLYPEEVSCGALLPSIVDRLRRAGVAHVLSLDAMEHSDLRLESELAPLRIAPLTIHVYALSDPLALRAVAGHARPASGPEEAESIASAAAFERDGGAAVEGLPTEVVGATGRVVSSRETSERIEMDVEADRPTVVLVRDGYAPGWSATVNGSPAPVLRSDGRHRAVPVDAGRSRVVLSYSPPRLWLGLVLTAVAAASALFLFRSGNAAPGDSRF